VDWNFWRRGSESEVVDHSEALAAQERAKEAKREANKKWIEVVDITSDLRKLREDNHLGARLGLAFERKGKSGGP
jgi:hypothetical protein